MKKSKLALMRTKRILFKDKSNIPDGFNALLSADLKETLSHYFELSEPFVKVKISLDDSGKYEIVAVAIGERLHDIPICMSTLE